MSQRHQFTLYGYTLEEMHTLYGILKQQFSDKVAAPEQLQHDPENCINGIHYHHYAQVIPLAQGITTVEEATDVVVDIRNAFRKAGFKIAHVARRPNSPMLDHELVTDRPPEEVREQQAQDLAAHRAQIRNAVDFSVNIIKRANEGPSLN